MDRKYSDGTIWDNSIDWDDADDGSDGGYTKKCHFIHPDAMRELVTLRAELAQCRKDAERYRWLRQPRLYWDVLHQKDEESVWQDLHGSELDDKIDAAMQGDR